MTNYSSIRKALKESKNNKRKYELLRHYIRYGDIYYTALMAVSAGSSIFTFDY